MTDSVAGGGARIQDDALETAVERLGAVALGALGPVPAGVGG